MIAPIIVMVHSSSNGYVDPGNLGRALLSMAGYVIWMLFALWFSEKVCSDFWKQMSMSIGLILVLPLVIGGIILLTP